MTQTDEQRAEQHRLLYNDAIAFGYSFRWEGNDGEVWRVDPLDVIETAINSPPFLYPTDGYNPKP